MEHSITVGISGATGAILAYKTIIALVKAGVRVELVISQPGLYTAAHELGPQFSTAKRFFQQLPNEIAAHVNLHGIQDIGAPIASGSYPSKGMVIVPCSMSTIAAISMGLGDNCLRRAADVTIKEKRPLILVPRETPLSAIHLENLLRLAKVGATILPPLPAWYHHPKSLSDVEDAVVGKILDCFGLEMEGYQRWGAINEGCVAH